MMASVSPPLTFEAQLAQQVLQVQPALTVRPVLQAQQVPQDPPARLVQIAL